MPARAIGARLISPSGAIVAAGLCASPRNRTCVYVCAMGRGNEVVESKFLSLGQLGLPGTHGAALRAYDCWGLSGLNYKVLECRIVCTILNLRSAVLLGSAS